VGPHSMKKRTLKSDKKKQGKQSRADPKRKIIFCLRNDKLLMKYSLSWSKREISLFPLPAVDFTKTDRCFDKIMGITD